MFQLGFRHIVVARLKCTTKYQVYKCTKYLHPVPGAVFSRPSVGVGERRARAARTLRPSPTGRPS